MTKETDDKASLVLFNQFANLLGGNTIDNLCLGNALLKELKVTGLELVNLYIVGNGVLAFGERLADINEVLLFLTEVEGNIHIAIEIYFSHDRLTVQHYYLLDSRQGLVLRFLGCRILFFHIYRNF